MTENERQPATQGEHWSELMRKSLQRELESFRQMLPSLLLSHKGSFVALSEGKIVDEDSNEFDLAERVTRRFPDRFVLIQEVTGDAPPKFSVQTVEAMP